VAEETADDTAELELGITSCPAVRNDAPSLMRCDQDTG